MQQLAMSISDEALAALNLPAEQAVEVVRLAAAVKLYELGRLSSGAAAALAGVPRTVFLERFADYDADTFRLTGDELREDLASAQA